jgi:ATP-dependent DNA helicase RecG
LSTPRPDEAAAPTLASPVTCVRGVGSERAALLARLGIETVGNLLLHRPRRYEDRRNFQPIRELREGEPATVRGQVVAMGTNRFKSGKIVFELIVDDGSARLHCRWWNLGFMDRLFAVGDDVLVFGKLHTLRPRTMDHPETEKVLADDEEQVHLNRIVPVYPATEGLSQRGLRGLTSRALQAHGAEFAEPHPELDLAAIRIHPTNDARGKQLALEARPLLPRAEAIRSLHFPAELTDADRARQRLAFDEFIGLQFEIQQRRLNFERSLRSLPCAGDNRLMKPFLAGLGFALTGAQQRVLREIRADFGGQVPMRRLLQGDVGSGKTLVAACAALMTLESGFDVAVMAPTEILAEQLWQNFRKWFVPLGIAVNLRTGSRKECAAGLQPAEPGMAGTIGLNNPTLVGIAGAQTCRSETGSTFGSTLAVGTHALIEDGFQSGRLGLAVIDEQQKFGVAQREKLVRKGRRDEVAPHLLVMTATPIPRTLGLTLYGDLDVSVLDELPGGRGRIRTHVRAPEALPKVLAFIRRELEKGRQAYVVYPRVEESEDDVKAVTVEFQKICRELAPHRGGLLHGRRPSEEKEAVMDSFRRGDIRILVATSVIEVGVDVPNATIMLIENAEQFGLAQLHQLRGRIGRGAHDSHCILVAEQKTDEARERLEVMAKTNDGFVLAEADLKLRGPGELTGRSQSGLPDFRFGDLVKDRQLVEAARELVRRHLRNE